MTKWDWGGGLRWFLAPGFAGWWCGRPEGRDCAARRGESLHRGRFALEQTARYPHAAEQVGRGDSAVHAGREARPKEPWPMPFLSSCCYSSRVPCKRDESVQLGWNGRNGELAKDYREGGARGEVARETSTEGERMAASTSNRCTTGTTARLKV